MTEKLTGAYIRIRVGTTVLGETKDDVSIAFNPEIRETKVHGAGRVIKKATHDAPVVSFGGLIVTSIGALEDLGLYAPSPNTLTGFKCALTDVNIQVYECEGDATPRQTITFNDGVVVINDMSWPNEDFAVWSGEIHVNGDLTLVPA